MAITRRKFLGMSAVAAASTMLPWRFGAQEAKALANSPNLSKWFDAAGNAMPLRGLGPTGIPVMAGTPDTAFPNTLMYNITVGEFTDVLHPDMGGAGLGLPTRLWGYWDTSAPVKKHLGGVILATRNQASRLRFTNTLPPDHIIPVDTTIPGADAGIYNKVATHLHGGLVPWISDGGPFDWWTPSGASGLSFLNGPGSLFDNVTPAMVPGQADYFYPNDQSTRLMWYHDHAHGITRINAYAGIATAYLCLDPNQEAALASKVPSIASTIPLVFQDKKFVHGKPANPVLGTPASGTFLTDPTWATVVPARVQSEGSLWYEHVYDPREFRLLKNKKMLPLPNPSAIPEFFGDTMLCNGTVYPILDVEPKAYRFLILNANNARFLNINLLQVATGQEIATNPKTGIPNIAVNPAGPPMVQIGTEGGYLVKEVWHPNGLFFTPATLTGNLLLGNAERADVIIDFTGMNTKEYIMYNDAPGPFPAGPPTTDYWLGNPKNPIQPLPGTGPDTRQILRIRVKDVAPTTTEPRPDPAVPIMGPSFMDPPALVTYTNTAPPILPLAAPAGTAVRDLTLNEDFDLYGRLRQLLGTVTINPVTGNYGREYLEPATEIVRAGSTEVWRIFNLTADTHPIHFHLVNVQILSRQPFKVVAGAFTVTGVARGPEPNELGWKETVQMHPGECTSVIMKFDLPAVLPFTVPTSPRTGGHEYVWHCHILEHEEHDMMRPLVVI